MSETPYIEKIIKNPFRVLGVYANASIRDIKANEAKAKAFLNVGKEVSYPCDFNQWLSPIRRTTEMMASANSQLTLPNEKIKHALFWFVKVTPLDEVAFNHLANGHVEQTMGIWTKKECFSSLLNISTQALIQGHFVLAVKSMMRLLETEQYRHEFTNAVTDATFQISEEELVHTYLDIFTEPAYANALLNDSILSEKYQRYIKEKLISPIISDIELEINKAKSIKRDNSKGRYNAGISLMNQADKLLSRLKKILSVADMRYQLIADKLGLEILQCGIDYFNNSDDADAAHKAMKLQNYAHSVVIGQMAIDRCKQNTDILKKIIAELPPIEVISEDRAIKKELEKFCKLPDKILYAIDLLNNTRPYLNIIKERLGSYDSYYLKISTQIVGNALHNLIEEVNESQKDETIEFQGRQIPISLLLDRDAKIEKIKEALRSAWKAIKLMDGFDMEYDFKTNRYNPNKSTLKNMCEQMGISTSSVSKSVPLHTILAEPIKYPRMPEPVRPTYTPPTPTSRSNSGCMIWIVLAFALGALISCI